MSQFEQENALGGGGGEVDDETMERAWKAAEERRGDPEIEEPQPTEEEPLDGVDT